MGSRDNLGGLRVFRELEIGGGNKSDNTFSLAVLGCGALRDPKDAHAKAKDSSKPIREDSR